MIKPAALSAVVAGAFALPASAAELRLGRYWCTIGINIGIGYMELDGSRYRGPNADQDYGGAYPYEVTPSGTINWGGPLGGLSSGGNTVVATAIVDTGGGVPGYDITVQVPSGNFQTVSCVPD